MVVDSQNNNDFHRIFQSYFEKKTKGNICFFFSVNQNIFFFIVDFFPSFFKDLKK